MRFFADILERRPAMGYIGSIIAAVPPWFSDLGEILKVLGALVGIVVGLLTAMIQARSWWRGRVR